MKSHLIQNHLHILNIISKTNLILFHYTLLSFIMFIYAFLAFTHVFWNSRMSYTYLFIINHYY